MDPHHSAFVHRVIFIMLCGVIYAGIDEAGYGPLLGPLCVGSVAFRFGSTADAPSVQSSDAPSPPDLWSLLSRAVCRAPKDTRRRIAIADSKKLKSGGKLPLIHLERGVLSFLPGELPENDAQFFSAVGIGSTQSDASPWHRSALPLPTSHTRDGLLISQNLARLACERAELAVERLAVNALDPAAFNALYRSLGNKAHVNMSLVFHALRAIDDLRGDSQALVVIDRQGGRASYTAELEAHVARGAQVRTIREDGEISTYAVGRGLFVSFEVEAETRHLPVALASMAAKYTRELSMARLNAYFSAFLPDLAPTAGYVEDGRRYLAEVKPILAQERIPHDAFVRAV
ncbi:MAG: hypothetical protein QM516_03120 [Limnohabitans sp.]|nr:hypothetical protein [Limnohabitans sp.]